MGSLFIYPLNGENGSLDVPLDPSEVEIRHTSPDFELRLDLGVEPCSTRGPTLKRLIRH